MTEPEWPVPRPAMVGRILDPAALGGGARAILTAARKAGGWWVWATAGTITKAVKVLSAAEGPGGRAVYEDRPHERVLVKGRRHDGRRFVVQYVEGKVESAYIATREHRATDIATGEEITWQTTKPTMRAASVTEVKRYLLGDV